MEKLYIILSEIEKLLLHGSVQHGSHYIDDNVVNAMLKYPL